MTRKHIIEPLDGGGYRTASNVDPDRVAFGADAEVFDDRAAFERRKEELRNDG